MGWCDNLMPRFQIIPGDPVYHGLYERVINCTLNAVRYRDYIQKYYMITKDGYAISKFPRGAIPKIWS